MMTVEFLEKTCSSSNFQIIKADLVKAAYLIILEVKHEYYEGRLYGIMEIMCKKETC